MTEREILRNLQAIVSDADNLKPSEVARKAIGVLSTENRKIWSGLRKLLQQDRNTAGCLQMIDRALFVVCLDDTTPEDLADLCSNFLCGTYNLQDGEQVGTCTNRWYDKVNCPMTSTMVSHKLFLCSFKSSSVLMVQLESISNIQA
jgi:carnitine O-acetyltransferase